MKQCDKGHFFDDNRFDSCPYCKEGTGLGKQAAVSFQNPQIPQYQPVASQPAAQKQFKFCTKCGNRADSSAKFCTGCGNQFPAMPQPQMPVQAPASDIGKTVAVQTSFTSPTSDIGKTVAVKPMSAVPSPTSDIGKTVAVQHPAAPVSAPASAPVSAPVPAPTPTSDIGKTVALQPLVEINTPASSPAVAPAVAPAVSPTSDIGKTVAVRMPEPEPAKKPEKSKPAAILVCISGENSGDFFAVCNGRNYIASGADADIKLDKDGSVSADCHAVVTYNPSDNKFTLSAGTSRGITYLNGNQVDVSAEVKADDRIKVGASELLFIPVCSDKFKWDAQA